jgi:putative phosphoesterase
MILGIVSDTHGHVEFAMPAVRMLESLEVEAVIHCGDIGSIEIVRLFDRWPTHYVLGNVDAHGLPFKAAIEERNGVYHGRFGALEIEGRRIAFLHGDDAPLLDAVIEGGAYDLVCHGHTHVAEKYDRNGTLVVNPGALYRAPRHTIAVARLPQLEVTHVDV